MKSVARLLVLGVFLFAVTNCGSSDEAKSAAGTQFAYLFDQTTGKVTRGSIYGTWKIAEYKGGDGVNDGRLRIEKDRIIYVNRCRFEDGLTLVAGVESPAIIENNKITIKEPKEDSVKRDRYVCTVKIPSGTIYYSISTTTNELSWGNNPRGTKISD